MILEVGTKVLVDGHPARVAYTFEIDAVPHLAYHPVLEGRCDWRVVLTVPLTKVTTP